MPNGSTNPISGRWFLTIMAGISFLLFSIAVTFLLIMSDLSKEALVGVFATLAIVINTVFKDYFHQKQIADQVNGNGHTSPPVQPVTVETERHMP